MYHVVVILTLCCALLSTRAASAQWAVEDLGAVGQRAAIWVEERLQWVDSIRKQVQQIEATYNLILGQAKQYEAMVRNLQRLPQGLGVIDTVLAYGNKLTGVLNQANMLGYDLDNATRQFAELYIDVGTIATGDLPAIRQRFLDARMQSSQVGVHMQSIKRHAEEIYQRLCRLLEASHQASGNLDAQQILHQQQALQLSTLQQMQALQATAARLQAQREAEDVALERIRIQLMQQFTTPLPTYEGNAGFLPVYRWVE
jgi:P-type conjugative transfer protein TrbJ